MSTYLGLATTSTPYVHIYKRAGDVLTKLANPATLPPANSRAVAWSPDSTYFAIGHFTSPYVTIYKRAGDVFTKLANPASLPAGTANGVSWSNDGTYLAVAHDTSPYLTVYKRAGDVFTKLSNPASLPAGNANGAEWSLDGTYLSVVSDASPYVYIYKRAGDVLTKLSNPTGGLPANQGYGTSWSDDGIYLSVSHFGSPYFTVYKRTGDAFAKIANPATLPANYARGKASWSTGGTYLSVPHGSSPYVTIYKRAGDVLTKLADPATLPANAAVGTSWSGDGEQLAVVHSSTPYVTVYSRAGDVFTKLANPATLPGGNGSSAAYSALLNAAPTAPPWTAPADNSYQNRDAALTLDWDFADPDGSDTQSAYALSKSVDGAALEYWNASTSAWVGSSVDNPTASTLVTLASGWAVSGESVEYKVKTLDAAGAAGPFGSGLTVNAAVATVPVIDAPASSATLTGSSADISWTVAAQTAYQLRVLSSADAELFSTGKVLGAVTEVTLGYVFVDGAVDLKIELTTWNANDIPGVDTNDSIDVSFTPPATPTLTVTKNDAEGYVSIAISDPTPAGAQPTVETHDVFVRVAAGGRQIGERTVGGVGIRISTGIVETDGTYLDYEAASSADFEYRTLAVAGTATAYSAWT
jgi:hypothetical protein